MLVQESIGRTAISAAQNIDVETLIAAKIITDFESCQSCKLKMKFWDTRNFKLYFSCVRG